MTKKSLSKYKKEVINQIQNQIDYGISKQEILDNLSEQYFDKSTISKLVASMANNQTKSKYKSLNNALLTLLMLTITAKFLLGFSLFM